MLRTSEDWGLRPSTKIKDRDLLKMISYPFVSVVVIFTMHENINNAILHSFLFQFET